MVLSLFSVNHSYSVCFCSAETAGYIESLRVCVNVMVKGWIGEDSKEMPVSTGFELSAPQSSASITTNAAPSAAPFFKRQYFHRRGLLECSTVLGFEPWPMRIKSMLSVACEWVLEAVGEDGWGKTSLRYFIRRDEFFDYDLCFLGRSAKGGKYDGLM